MQEFSDQMPSDIKRYPMVPIRDVVIFPFTKVAFKIGRPSSVRALEQAMTGDRDIFLATQHDATVDEPSSNEVYSVGTLGRILQAQRQDNGQIKVVVEGRERGQSVRVEQTEDGMFFAQVRKVASTDESGYRTDGLLQKIHTLVEQFLRVSPDAYTDALHASLRGISAAQIADAMSSHLRISVEEKQDLLETISVSERLQKLVDILETEIEKRQLDRSIHSRTKKQMDKHQREYYLNEQIKAIHKELGRKDEKAELDDLKKKIDNAGMTEEAKEKALQEFARLEAMPPMSAESTVSRTYLDWLINVPWKNRYDELNDLGEAEKTLNEDHYGLEKIKERILEFLAVRQLVANPKGTILCFVGAPGVGKTSLGKSIANATGRKFMRLALGGVHDEAEIRGHRRTYIGAMPGRIIQAIQQAGTNNPLIMLDEIDKVGADFRGDPSSALLEVLDPEQNNSFRDNYLGVTFDLSNVIFMTTANVLDTIQPALRDRMEVIRLAGYTEEEKREIALRHLLPKQMEENGITPRELHISKTALTTIIQQYTQEAGLRQLEREIGRICRKVARRIAESHKGTIRVSLKNVHEFLGAPKIIPEEALKKDQIGVATGLAWTAVGGDVLFIEALRMKGKGNLVLTGQLGEVMRESAQAAYSYAKSRAKELDIAQEDFSNYDLHIHIPEGAIPKDGPSAGITLATAMVSALSLRPVRKDVAMTGEITLRGNVLPIGGVKEKVLAARRARVSTIILPQQNRRDMDEVPKEPFKDIRFVFVDNMRQVFREALKDRVAPPASSGPRPQRMPQAANARPV